MAEFIADAAEKIAQNRVFADLTHGIVVRPCIEGAAEPEIRLYSFSPALFNDVQVQIPISSLLDDPRCGEPDRIPYDDAHMGMFGYIAKRIEESGRYTDITGMQAHEIGSIAEEECMTRIAAGDLFESPELNAAFSPYSSVKEIDGVTISRAADRMMEGGGMFYDAERNLLVTFLQENNPLLSKIAVGHVDFEKAADALSACSFVDEGLVDAYSLGSEQIPFIGIDYDSVANYVCAALLSYPGFTEVGDMTPEDFFRLAGRDESELTDPFQCIAVGANGRFNVLPEIATAHIDLQDSGRIVNVDGVDYPLMEGTDLEEAQKANLLLAVRGALQIDEHEVTVLFDGREAGLEASGLDDYAVSEALGKQIDDVLSEIDLITPYQTLLGIRTDGNVPERIAQARELWEELGDVCVDDGGNIDEQWNGYPAGTNREEIWHDFEDKFGGDGVTVAKLMGLEPWGKGESADEFLAVEDAQGLWSELCRNGGCDEVAIRDVGGELNVVGLKDGQVASSWEVRAVKGTLPDDMGYSDAVKAFNMGAEKICVPGFREQIAEAIAKQRAAHSRLDALGDKMVEAQEASDDLAERRGNVDDPGIDPR